MYVYIYEYMQTCVCVCIYIHIHGHMHHTRMSFLSLLTTWHSLASAVCGCGLLTTVMVEAVHDLFNPYPRGNKFRKGSRHSLSMYIYIVWPECNPYLGSLRPKYIPYGHVDLTVGIAVILRIRRGYVPTPEAAT